MIPSPLPYIAVFERLGYGLFVHWGIYSQLNLGEKNLLLYGIPKDEYKALMNTFTAMQRAILDNTACRSFYRASASFLKYTFDRNLPVSPQFVPCFGELYVL